MIYVLSGGQTGATLTVNSSDAGTITVSNTTLGKSYSKSVAAGGSAVFKGLATGKWTVKLTDGSKTSTKTITITSDYSTNIAYFSATISITYPATSTCVVKNSGGQTVASNTNTGSSTKTWAATVGATGTYTVTATSTSDSSKTKSTTVSITADGQSKSVTLSYSKYLIQNGVPTDITGGFTSGATSSGVFVISAPAAGTYYTVESKSNNTISREGYKTLKFDGYIKDASSPYAKYGTASVAVNSTSRKTFSLDISSISSGKISLEFLVLIETSYSHMYVYNLWLE